MRVYEKQVLAPSTVATNQTSAIWQLHQMFNAAASCVVSGGGNDAAGTLTMTGSVDGTNFEALQVAGAPMTLTVSGNGTYLFDVTETALQYLQVTYTAASGTGLLSVDVYSKGF